VKSVLEEIVKFALIRKMKIFSINTMRDFARMIGDNEMIDWAARNDKFNELRS